MITESKTSILSCVISSMIFDRLQLEAMIMCLDQCGPEVFVQMLADVSAALADVNAALEERRFGA